MVLEALPLNANGKVDRNALPHPEFVSQVYEAPQGAVEQALAAIWSEVLGVPRVGRHDNFFALGGHSLLMLQMQILGQQRLGMALALRDCFEQPSLAALAAHIDSVSLIDSESLTGKSTSDLDRMAELLSELEQ
jgi:hypothetical protein